MSMGFHAASWPCIFLNSEKAEKLIFITLELLRPLYLPTPPQNTSSTPRPIVMKPEKYTHHHIKVSATNNDYNIGTLHLGGCWEEVEVRFFHLKYQWCPLHLKLSASPGIISLRCHKSTCLTFISSRSETMTPYWPPLSLIPLGPSGGRSVRDIINCD